MRQLFSKRGARGPVGEESRLRKLWEIEEQGEGTWFGARWGRAVPALLGGCKNRAGQVQLCVLSAAAWDCTRAVMAVAPWPECKEER